MKKVLAVATALLMGVAPPVLAGDETHWVINGDLEQKVKDFIRNSPVVEDMRADQVKNDMVYGGESDDNESYKGKGQALLPIYDLLACIHLTNPSSKMDVDSGGGFDMEIEEAQFAKGKWDTTMRIVEHVNVDFLEKTTILILDKFVVGDLRLRKVDEKLRALKMLSAACFETPVSQD